jgi:hypothetical protein
MALTGDLLVGGNGTVLVAEVHKHLQRVLVLHLRMRPPLVHDLREQLHHLPRHNVRCRKNRCFEMVGDE